MRRRLLILSFILALFAPVAAAVFHPQQASADVPGVGNNLLQLVAEHCHDLKEITHDFGIGSNVQNGVGQCHAAQPGSKGSNNQQGWEEVLNDALGCSSDMFYQHDFTDPNDNSKVTKTLWYTHLGAYKDCYNKAQTMFNNMTNDGPNGQCKLASEGSQNFQNCQADVHNLFDALGCSTHMLKKSDQKDSQGNNYSTVDPSDPNVKDCQKRIDAVGNQTIVIFDGSGKTTNSPKISDPSVTADSGDGGTNGSGSSDAPSLDCNVSFNPLTWVICPAVQGMVSIVGDLDNAINSQLSVGTPGNSDDPNQIFCDSNTASSDVNSCKAYHNAWSSFRNISLGLLAVVGLVIIISEMAGFELLDAYTLRKVLPRLIFAAIAITLSWQLMQFFVTLTNDLGYGIRFLIYQPFVHAGIDTNTLNGGGLVAANLIAGSAIIALSVFGLLSFAATAALAVFVAFLTLIIRQLLIIILIIIAPLAILAYVLPNTQGGWKLWWNSFSRALLMFPLIAAFIAAGRVFSAVADSGSSGTLGQLMGFAAYFAPYFLIPLTFRFAGGAISAIGGFVNDRHRGAFDRLGNFRKQRFDKNMQDLAAGNRYKASNPVARGFNKFTRGAALAPTAGVTPWKWRSRWQAGLSQQQNTALSKYMEESEAFKTMSGNDDYNQATMKTMGGGDTEEDWRRYLRKTGKYDDRQIEQGVAIIRAAKRDTNDDIFKDAAVLANFSTGTGFQEGGIGQAMAAINEASGGDRDKAARLTAQSRGLAERAQRWDLAAPGFGTEFGALQEMHQQFQDIDSDATLTNDQKADRKNAIQQDVTGRMLEAGYYTHGDAGAVIRARGQSMKLLAPRIRKRIEDAHSEVAVSRQNLEAARATGNTQAIAQAEERAARADRAMGQEYAYLANLKDQANYASPEVATQLANSVFNANLDGGNGPTISENLERIKRNTDSPIHQAYVDTRNDFDARQAAAQQGQQFDAQLRDQRNQNQ